MARTKEFNENDVLSKAVDLFSCKGYNATSAQDLVDCLGISRSSLYDTYGDKRGLFIMALQKYNEREAANTIRMINEADDIEQAIKAMFKNVLADSVQDKQGKGCFMVNSTIEMSPHDADIAAIINSSMQDMEDALYRAIKRGQASGQISADKTPRSLARFFINTISGIRVAAKSGTDKRVFEDVVKVALSTLK